MKTTSVICDICGKSCKNLRGLKIHLGHMHNGKSKSSLLIEKNILEELYSLRQLIIDLTYKINITDTLSINNERLQEPPPKKQSSPTGDTIIPPQQRINYLGYGCDHGALMDELKSVLKERVLVST